MIMEYFNPAAFKPDVDFKPTGPLAGQIWADRENEYGQLMNMFKENQGLDLTKKNIELEEFMKQSPLRDLEMQAKGATAQGTIQTAVPLAQATLDEIQGRNRLAEGTLQSKISEAATDAYIKKDKRAWDTFIQGHRKAAALAAQADQIAPGWRETGLPAIISSQLDPNDPMDRMILQSGGNSGKVLESIAMSDPKSIQEMAKQRLQNEGQLASTKESAAATRYSSDRSAEWHRAQIQMQQEAKEKNQREEKRMEELWKIVQDKTKPMPKREEAKALLEFMIQRRFSEKQAGAGVGPGFSSQMMGGKGAEAVPKPVQ